MALSQRTIFQLLSLILVVAVIYNSSVLTSWSNDSHKTFTPPEYFPPKEEHSNVGNLIEDATPPQSTAAPTTNVPITEAHVPATAVPQTTQKAVSEKPQTEKVITAVPTSAKAVTVAHSTEAAKTNPPDEGKNRIEGVPQSEIDTILNAAKNNQLVVTTVNVGFIEFARNWYKSLQKIDVNNFLIICEDTAVCGILKSEIPGHSVELFPTSTTSATKYDGKEYGELVKKRPFYIRVLLEAFEFDILYSDVDVAILRDPFPYVDAAGMHDVYVQSDTGSPSEALDKVLCTGFVYFRNTEATRSMIRQWEDQLSLKTGTNLNQPTFTQLVKQLRNNGDIRLHMLDMASFVNGSIYWKHKDWLDKQGKELVMVHANWMIGADTKRKSLKDAGFWVVDS